MNMTSGVPRKRKRSLHPSIRLSLFPNVPPYVRFSDDKTKTLPACIRKTLLWKFSNVTPFVVKKLIKHTGYRMLNESIAWKGVWGNQVKVYIYRKLRQDQKFNHLPGTVEIGRKDLLWRNIRQMKSKCGEKKFNIMPTTFVLPQERNLFEAEWNKNDEKDQCWIIKPPASYRGDGIKIIRKYKEIPYCTPVVAQKYVRNPYLINDTKFDLRLYVLMTSVNPLRIYWYKNGLVRFASTKYSMDLKSLGDRFIHLTNYSVNKFNEKYIMNSEVNAYKGHKWTVEALWKYLETEHNVDVKQLQLRLADLIVKTIICGEHAINKAVAGHLRSRYNAYELFGFDVIFDNKLQPWLLEVNISPSLAASSPVDIAVKTSLMQEVLNIVGFHIPPNKKISDEKLASSVGYSLEARLSLDSRIYSIGLSYAEKYKQNYYMSKTRRSDYLKTILKVLTPDDLRQLIIYEDELTQVKSFQRIFPTHKTYKYFQFFDRPRYYNQLLDAWEQKYHGCRKKGIELLKRYCQKGVHLRTSNRITGKEKT